MDQENNQENQDVGQDYVVVDQPQQEFVSEEDTGQELASDEGSPKQQRGKNKHPFKDRISQLVHKNKALAQESQAKDQTLYSLQVQLAERERLIAEKDQALRQKEAETHKVFENNLEIEERSIIENLKRAKIEGDIDAEVKYEQDLARVKANQSSFDIYKHQNQINQAQQQEDDTVFYPELNPYQQPQPYIAAPELPEALGEFLDRNPWCNPQSPHFNPALANEAEQLAGEFKNYLDIHQQSELSYTPDFYSSIENAMRAQYALNSNNEDSYEDNDQMAYNDNYDNQYQQPRQQQQRQPYSSGVSRPGASMADQYAVRNQNSGGKPIALNTEQYNVARNLRIPDPRRAGGYIEGDDAVRIAAQEENKLRRYPNTKHSQFRRSPFGFSVE
jgi:hypothetical protein